eukprot:scaffold225269_cov17-Prasinocladus_malaysianus.AAC.1
MRRSCAFLSGFFCTKKCVQFKSPSSGRHPITAESSGSPSRVQKWRLPRRWPVAGQAAKAGTEGAEAEVGGAPLGLSTTLIVCSVTVSPNWTAEVPSYAI